DHLDSIDHAAHRFLYMAKRYKTLGDMARTLGLQKLGELPNDQQEAIIHELQSLRTELVDLTCEFQRLWLKRNKFPKLDFNLERLQERLISQAQRRDSILFDPQDLEVMHQAFLWL
ncbi:unnamed protein product, partial [marine sediment metagenome]